MPATAFCFNFFHTTVLGIHIVDSSFNFKVGHLKPGSSASVVIKYVCELPVEDKAVRLTIPTTIAPRYNPPTDNSEARLSEIKYAMDSPSPLNIEVR